MSNSRRGSRPLRLLVILLVSMLSLTGCVHLGAEPVVKKSPATQRSVAAIALRHLPHDTIGIGPANLPKGQFPEGAVGAILRYEPRPGDKARAVIVLASAMSWESFMTECSVLAGCRELGPDVYLLWTLATPLGDPGTVMVVRAKESGIVTAAAVGTPIKGDPLDLDLQDPSIDDLQAVVDDPDLGIDTTSAALAEGEALEGWTGN